uniref:Uncharacterized protein n=1 Tax=Ixodes ricinus TaxID=34613 RepID=A0A0K8RE16_IXORI
MLQHPTYNISHPSGIVHHGPSGHKYPVLLPLPNHPSDSVQTNLPTTFLHCSITCVYWISIESNKTTASIHICENYKRSILRKLNDRNIVLK